MRKCNNCYWHGLNNNGEVTCAKYYKKKIFCRDFKEMEYTVTIGEDNENGIKIGDWEEVKNVVTPGGDPLWKCPFCGKDEHLWGVENLGNYHEICNNCSAELHYPKFKK